MPKTKYDEFTAEEFASDDHFIDWCLHQDEIVNAYWSEWLRQHPRQRGAVDEARKTVILLHRAEKTDVQSAMKKAIWSHVDAHINKENPKKKTGISSFHLRRFAAVAASFLVLFVTYQLFNSVSKQVEWTQHANHSDQIEVIKLPDGTEVALRPQGVLSYSTQFGDQKREIALQGEAFFDVARDTTKPFLVFANQTITKVLGTSFLVKAIKGKKVVEVEVVSGRVAVMANVSKLKETRPSPLVFKKGDIEIPKPNYKINLRPNEKISFDLTHKDMVKSIVETPKLLKQRSAIGKVDFHNDPVTEVFKALEVAYGINLEYDTAQLIKCSISTKLDDSSLFTKLDIICAALELSYKQKDAVIYIRGNGCT